MGLHSIRSEMRSQVVLAGALLALMSACGGSVVDPASARCPAPPATFGKRVVRSDHAEIAIRYKCEGASISGTLYLPKSDGRHSALVWVHGGGAEARLHWGSFLRPFIDAGVAVASFDKRGVGESGGKCCPGDTGHFNLLTADAVGAVSAVRRGPGIDPGRVGLFGASQAGWIVPRAAVDSGRVAFVVLAAPGIVTFGQEHRYEQLTGGYRSDKPFPSKKEIAEKLGGPSGFDVVPYLRRMDVPALWLLAGRDQEIPLDQSLAILRRLEDQGKHYTIHVYAKANHGLFDVPSTDPRALPDTLDWLHQHT
jgi:dipeptidyl aminopeptidase/acylaminoacyl peptidase